MVATKTSYRFLWFAGLAILILASFCALKYSHLPKKPLHDQEQEAVETPDESIVVVSNEEAWRWREKAMYDGRNQGPLQCRLMPWPIKPRAKHTPDLQLKLTNTSAETVTLWDAGYHVTLLVRDEAGKIVKEFRFAWLSSSMIIITNGKLKHPPPLRN